MLRLLHGDGGGGILMGRYPVTCQLDEGGILIWWLPAYATARCIHFGRSKWKPNAKQPPNDITPWEGAEKCVPEMFNNINKPRPNVMIPNLLRDLHFKVVGLPGLDVYLCME